MEGWGGGGEREEKPVQILTFTERQVVEAGVWLVVGVNVLLAAYRVLRLLQRRRGRGGALHGAEARRQQRSWHAEHNNTGRRNDNVSD